MFNTALHNIRRSPYQALSVICVLTLNFFIIAIFALISFASQIILSHFETRPQIIAYLSDKAKTEEINQTINDLNVLGQVKSINYVSKDQALALYKESVGNDPLLLGTVTELGEVTADILPASLEISVKSASGFEDIVQVLSKSSVVSSTSQGVKEIDFPKDVIDQLVRWTRGIRLAGLILIAILTIVSIVTISLLVSLRISTRRLEINTLKLIGARNWFIIKPYIFEILIYSIVSATIGWLLSYIALLYSTPFLMDTLSGIISLPVSPLIILYLWLSLIVYSLVFGIFAALVSSIRFVNR